MAISFVGSASGSITTAGSSVTVSYSPTAGNYIVVACTATSTVFSHSAICQDNNGNQLTEGSATGTDQDVFYGVAVSGATSYKLSWSTISAKAAIVVME